MTPSTTRSAGGPALVGREGERDLLVELAVSPPAVAMVEGEAGVGKSRLVREMVGRPAVLGRRMLLGRCHPLREPFWLGPVVEALRRTATEPPAGLLSDVTGVLRPLLPELSRHLPPRPDPVGGVCAERHRVFRALRELLGAFGECVCVLEDLHWADEGTLELLSYLVAEPPESLFLVLTYRGEQVEPSSALRTLLSRVSDSATTLEIELAPLSAAEVGVLASAILGTDVPEAFAISLHRRTAGIPFAVEQLVAALSARGHLDPAKGGWPGEELERLAVPPALRDTILEPMQALSRDARLIACAAAVLERPADEDLLRAVAGLPPIRGEKGLNEALARGPLEERGESLYGFRHALAARSVYEHVSGPERRRLHLRAAQALEWSPQPRSLSELALHFQKAGRRREWLRYVEAAADAASSVGDDPTAAELLAEALATPNLSRAASRRMALKLGTAALFGRTPGKAIPVLEATLTEDSLPTGLRGEVRLSLARLLLSVADLAAAKRELARASEELRRRPALAARALAILAAAGRSSDGDADRQRSWLEGAREAAAGQDERTIETEVRAAHAAVLIRGGDRAGWRSLDDLPWTTTSDEERLELVRTSKHLARAALAVGHHQRAESLLDRGERIRGELGHERFAVGLASIRAWLEWRTGRWEGLEAKARRLMDANAQARGLSVGSELTVASLLLARGETGEADERFASILETVQGARLPLPLATAASALARIQLASGDAPKACELAAVGIVGIRARDLWACSSTVAPVAVDALIAGGRRTEAEELVTGLGRGVRGREAPAARAALDHCHGALAEADGRLGPAGRSFARAERAWRALPSPYEAARARERRGWCLLAGNETKAANCLVGALEDLHALGAAWDAARVRDGLKARGISLPHPWRPGRRAYGSELSPREAEVAGLAATGRTNRAIAGELFISERTVEKHVSAALRKLGLTSREAIAQRVREKK